MTKIPHVDNSRTGPRILRDVMTSCVAEEDSLRRRLAIEDFLAEWAARPARMILEPTWVMTLVATSPWTRTTGREDLPGIAAPLPGNRGNWLDLQAQMFLPRLLAKDAQPIAASAGADVVATTLYTLPTGLARYVYNRSADPRLWSLETDDPRWIDSVVKVGRTFEVYGSTRDLDEGLPWIDSLMGRNSWLVLASSPAVEAVDSAMRPTWELCQSRSRVRAWKIQDSLVWLDPKNSIPLAELLSMVRLASTSATPDTRNRSDLAHVSRDAHGVTIDLSRKASVRVVTPSGRIVLGGAALDAGRHRIETESTRGILLVQIREGSRTEVHRVLP